MSSDDLSPTGTEPLPFGALLRRIRMEKGMSLSELARRSFYSKGYLSKIENGIRTPAEDVVRRCDGVLDAGGRLITSHRSADTPLAPGDGANLVDGGSWVLQMDGQGSMWFQPLDRRQALAAGVRGAAGAASMMALGGVAPPGRRRAGADTVAAFTAVFGELRGLGQRTTPEIMLPTLIAQTGTLRTLIGETRGRDRRELAGLAARYAEYTGWMAQEAGQDRAALWWTDTAVDLAAEGGDEELAAYGLVRRALITLYGRDGRQTVALARQAQRDPAAGPRVRGLAAQREAQGHAVDGEATNCLRALDLAEELLSGGPGHGLVLGSMTVANPVALTRAWCLHDLGYAEEAATLFEREILASPPGARRFRARWNARRALALATAGELDQVCALLPELLTDCAFVESATVHKDLAALSRVLSRRLGHPPVRAVYPLLTAALHVPLG
ncbi:MAG TPA: helix-turn-helix transcriptional regulator [Pseudonocardiaceae bacterium]